MEYTLVDLQKTLLDMLCDFDKFCCENGIQYSLSGGNVLGAVRHKGFIPWDDDIDVYLTRENYDLLLEKFQNNEKYTLQRDTEDYPMQFSKLRLNNTTFIEDINYQKKYRKIHQGVYIDIFPLDKVSTNKVCAGFQKIFSNIILSQSLFLRGYTRYNFAKVVVTIVSVLFLPFRKLFLKFVKSFNKQTDFEKYCDYYGLVKKVYFDKESYNGELPRLTYEQKQFPVMKNYLQYLEDTYGDYMTLPTVQEQQLHVHAKMFDLSKDYSEYI